MAQPGQPHKGNPTEPALRPPIDRIRTYTEGQSFERFCADVRTSDAVQYNFMVIGEAANPLPSELTDLHPELPWKEMRGLRNVLAHTYFAVSLSILWETGLGSRWAVKNDEDGLISHGLSIRRA